MNWLTVSDWLHEHTCFARQRTGCCGCNGRAACRKGQTLKDTCERLDKGIGTDTDAESVLAFVRSKTCHKSRAGEMCNHRGCDRAERVQAWIIERISELCESAAA